MTRPVLDEGSLTDPLDLAALQQLRDKGLIGPVTVDFFDTHRRELFLAAALRGLFKDRELLRSGQMASDWVDRAAAAIHAELAADLGVQHG